jgi:large subunit ribosomal protein L4
MKLSVVDTAGKQLREIDVADEVFGLEPNASVLHQAYVAQMANRRVGGAHTLRRGEVRGSTAKIRKQKGLGRSRQGGIRASHHVGGGVAMGPRPHSFAKGLPRNMKRLAIRSALSSKAMEGRITIVEGLVPSEPRTKALQDVLEAVGADRTTLVVSGEAEQNLQRAAHNIATAKALPAQYLNVVDIVNAHSILMTEDAVRKAESLWGGANLKVARGATAEVAS